jgi:hypothetical protein
LSYDIPNPCLEDFDGQDVREKLDRLSSADSMPLSSAGHEVHQDSKESRSPGMKVLTEGPFYELKFRIESDRATILSALVV